MGHWQNYSPSQPGLRRCPRPGPSNRSSQYQLQGRAGMHRSFPKSSKVTKLGKEFVSELNELYEWKREAKREIVKAGSSRSWGYSDYQRDKESVLERQKPLEDALWRSAKRFRKACMLREEYAESESEISESSVDPFDDL